jgi:hypothetical protein
VRLSTKEAALILGFLIQDEINFSVPSGPEDLMKMKEETYSLLESLHGTFNEVFINKLKENLEKKETDPEFVMDEKGFFGTGNMLTEPIFYSGTGVYDIQYLEFLDAKYARDKKWLKENMDFDIEKVKKISLRIKDILQAKSERVRLSRPREHLPEVRKQMKGEFTDEEWEKNTKELLPIMEIYQYVNLFFDNSSGDEVTNMNEIREEGWRSFYTGLIDLFVIRKSDFSAELEVESFLRNFSIVAGKDINSHLQTIGDYNEINAHPILRLDGERYFVPVAFLVFEAVYESPFYWMIDDDAYKDCAGENRGKVGEQLAYDFLVKVFGPKRTFKSVKIKSLRNKDSIKKRSDKTDIDVLCVLGNKALCVQVKSKKLTEFARKGRDDALGRDFEAAVQDAYDQGKVSRLEILTKKAQFIDENDKEIMLSEAINEIYIMGITTENYPSLTHQTSTLLKKEEGDPFPLFLTIFDLELLAHYLADPYDFLYYIRQRINLMDYFKADEEIVFLGYHLTQKLWRMPKYDFGMIDNAYGQLVDRNYYPYKLGMNVPTDGDRVANRWKDENFNRLCDRIKTINEPRITDVIFHLYDWSGDARENLVKYILSTKQKVAMDDKSHNFSMPPDEKNLPRVGVTYFAIKSNDYFELRDKLVALVHLRKYKSKGDTWIGFGSLKDSNEIIDSIFVDESPWEYNQELEKLSNEFLEGAGGGRFIRLGEKIGRNEKCPCGSGLKYKKCCGDI